MNFLINCMQMWFQPAADFTCQIYVHPYSTCGLAEEIEQGKEPLKKTATSSCGSVSCFTYEFIHVEEVILENI